ncbi:MAG: serpin family protein [Microcystis sp. M038S2]|nr:serpin family protein [Microcystis sp. M046S2]MCA2706971.1 serpin family protein [Microcystis sp. M038S2]MCA2947135.1 serpin family protein [Microcystis sp. M109S1]MCA2954062.1 serpin family protein [Microcystis sp. M112S1]NCS51061.1 serpin family protein [Microcystis aeruginosa G13-05]
MKKLLFISIGVILAAYLELLTLSFAEVGQTQDLRNLSAKENLPSFLSQLPEATNLGIVQANNRFSFKIFSELFQQQPNQNIAISPTSLAIALAMTYNGASGKTQQAMSKTLELEGISLEEVNQANAALKDSWRNLDPEVQLSIANSLWIRQGMSFNLDFLQRVREAYAAQIDTLDFKDPSVPSLINKWVRQNTNGKIDVIVDTLDPDSAVLIFNAIYFKGKWKIPFPKDQSQDLPFHLLNGTQKQHPMMSSRKDDYPYYENDLFQSVSLPYGNGRLSMYVFLPKLGISLEDFHRQLNSKTWEQWMTHFKLKEGVIQLPRFKFDYEITLNDTLKALGMGVAFDRNLADFSGMIAAAVEPYTNKFSIDQVKQKIFIEVNEEGTEAAAVTGVMTLYSLNLDTFHMVVDRPFFFAIRDNQTGTILFMGSILEPK